MSHKFACVSAARNGDSTSWNRGERNIKTSTRSNQLTVKWIRKWKPLFACCFFLFIGRPKVLKRNVDMNKGLARIRLAGNARNGTLLASSLLKGKDSFFLFSSEATVNRRLSRVNNQARNSRHKLLLPAAFAGTGSLGWVKRIAGSRPNLAVSNKKSIRVKKKVLL